MESVFTVLAEPHRRQIVNLLRERERTVGELVDALEISQPAVSKHLRVLKEAGLVESRSDAQRRVYTLRIEPLIELDDWLSDYRSLWAKRLDRLEQHVQRMMEEEMASRRDQGEGRDAGQTPMDHEASD